MMPKKIAILGISGSGKTTLAAKLSREIGVPHIELDRLVHLPGWKEASSDDVQRQVNEVLGEHRERGWVIDGNYDAVLGDVRTAIYKQADAVVWIDLSLPRTLYRLTRRVLIDYLTQRDLYNGNRQNLRFAFFQRDSLITYAVKSHYQRRRTHPQRFRELGIDLIRLRTPREVDAWTASVVDGVVVR
jgi:adenylate kinase family enzyme